MFRKTGTVSYRWATSYKLDWEIVMKRPKVLHTAALELASYGLGAWRL